MEKTKKEPTCCTCQQDFDNLIKNEVDQVEGYTKADHERKEKEVDTAFDKEKK